MRIMPGPRCHCGQDIYLRLRGEIICLGCGCLRRDHTEVWAFVIVAALILVVAAFLSLGWAN
jgi:hypothetical protein